MIDFNKSRQYTLSIRLSTDGFCFAVHNPQTDNEYAYQPYRIDPSKPMASNLKAAIEETQMLRHTYGTVNITLANIPYTLLPKGYYDEQYERELFQYNIASPNQNSSIIHNVIADGKAAVLFAIEKQLHKLITTHYPKANVYAAITPIINFGVERSYTMSKRYCLLHVHRHSIDFMCHQNGEPLFINTFKYKDTTDALFYLLNSWSILGLSQTDDTLHIAGQLRHCKAINRDLEKFIQNIHIIRPAEEFHSTELARTGEIPFDLQALIACE